MAGLNFEVKIPRRAAEVDVSEYWSMKHNIPEGTTPCHVLGVFQDSSEDGAYPVMVCELNDGRVLTQAPETIKFVDTKDGMML